MLEIGPGLGVLTTHLVEQAGRVTAVELDQRLLPLLQDRFAAQDSVQLIHGDILELDPADLMPGPYKVVANLPYYITSAVLRHLLESSRPPTLAVVLVQREVAQRITAEPGSLSLLAVSVQFYARPQIVHRIPAGAFHPRPKVESAVLRLDVRPQPAVKDVSPRAFFRVVKAGFSQKRKQLRNSLSAGLGMDKGRVSERMLTGGIEPRRRAETLTLEEWGLLTRLLLSESHSESSVDHGDTEG